MKGLFTVVSLLLSGVLSEAPAPYPPSGWRPNGPAFQLPTKTQTQLPQRPEYLPPVDPRIPFRPTEYDSGVDVSVQGLPTQEQLPIFQVSPVNGQQYVGPNFNTDIRGLEQNFQQSQFQLQQEKARQFSRQQQFPANPNAASGLPNPQQPRQFVPQTTPATTTTTVRSKEVEPTTESDLNQGETLDDKNASPKIKNSSVEVSKQNLQEYPAELFLSSLAQLQLQPQFVPLQQFGQIREPVFYQTVQQSAPEKQEAAGFDGPAHFAALPSVLAQNQLASRQQALIPAQQTFVQNPALLVPRGQEQPSNPIIVPAVNQEPLPQYQPVVNQYQPIAQPQYQPIAQPQYQPIAQPQYQPIAQPQLNQEPLPQYQPAVQTQAEQEPLSQYQPTVNQYQPIAQPQLQQYPQYQAQPIIYQPQTISQSQPQSQSNQRHEETEENDQEQPQYVYQQSYQPQQVYQPQEVYQPQYPQPQIPANQYPQQNVFLPQGQQNYPNQDLNQYYQNQLTQQQYLVPNQFGAQPIVQGQDAFLQSGLDINQEGNGIEQAEERDENSENDDDEKDDGAKATAVATAFGARTQPRVFSQYGAPAQRPRDQANRGYPTTTESTAEETTEAGPAVAQASAVASPSRSRNAKLRSRRPRPVFTVDRSGHLVLTREK
ncbi:unnamed protein product [Parnassius apollo]|uniref:(apollo) hypothetical protein n=1 Tax=Parnassius apollo TaxID=110799 RepID=A0A8S3WGY7_PARAO|nr:unnamed protein product [Parnassius apollo]